MDDHEPLDEIAAMRKRPGMYTGDCHDGSGLLHLLWEVVGNAVDEHLAGFCRTISVTLHDDAQVTVEDDGRGMPVALIETAFTRRHDRATLDGHVKHVHLDGGGLGVVLINALSRSTVVETARDGRRHRQEFRAGALVGPLVDLGSTEATGTRITFAPDPAIFSSVEFDVTQIRERLHDIAGFCPGLTLRFADERRSTFSCPSGIVDMLARQCRGSSLVLESPLRGVGDQNGVQVDVALQWVGKHRAGRMRSFVNLRETCEGGTHVTGLKRALNQLVPDERGKERRRVVSALQARAAGIISVFHHAPSFESPTRSLLKSPEVQPVVEAVVRRCLSEFATNRPDEVRRLIASIVDG